MKIFFLALAFVAALTHSAFAKDWQVDYARSSLTFTGEQSGEKFSGGFRKFTAQISLDPAYAENGKINVVIDSASAYAGTPDRDQMLPQADWFDTAKFPQAQFTATAIRQTAPGHYQAAATLTIKGLTHNVTLPFTLTQEGDHWHAHGQVDLMRNDFAVGQGMFAKEDYVKYPVAVTVDIVAD